MEKFRAKNRKLFPRLLIVAILAAVSAPAAFSEPQFHIVSMQQYCFTDVDCEFDLQLENIQPKDVQSFVEDVQDDVKFVSSCKDDLANAPSATGKNGTLIQVWFRFLKPGVFDIGVLTVRISGVLYKIPFGTVTVYQNPDSLQPQLFIKFNNQIYQSQGSVVTCTAGTHLDFTLYIKYAVQIVNYSWSLPENSIFKETKRYEITQGNPRGGGFSPDAITVASFEWQPLTKGRWSLPKIIVTATAYNGSRYDLTLPPCTIDVMESSQQTNSADSETNVFAYAFSQPLDVEKTKTVSVQKIEHPEKIVELRCKERHSFPFNKYAEQRRAAEIEAGIPSDGSEPSIPLFVLLLVCCIICISLTIVFLVVKKSRKAAFVFTASLLMLTGTIISGALVSRSYALFIGGPVNSIPEEKNSTNISIRAGSRVRVLHSAGNWVYVHSNDTYGWVQKENVYYIK